MSVYLNLNIKASLLKYLRYFLLILGFSAFLAGCATSPTGNQQTQRPTNQQGPAPDNGPATRPGPNTKDPKTATPKTPTPKTPSSKDGLTPIFMDSKDITRIAIILPFSAKSERLRAEASSMLLAAELALFTRDDDNVLLIALDSRGTPEGAKQAAKSAQKQGASVILGPILAGSVKASGKEARKSGTPVIAFSTDTSAAGNGVYLLSFPPEAEVARVSEYAAQSGARKFAYIGPNSVYGRRVLGAYRAQVANLDGVMSGVETYAGKDISVMQDPAQKLALYYGTSEEILAGKDPGFHAVMLPEGGIALRSLAPLLSFYNEEVRSSNVQLLGTGLWNHEDAAREPALNGGIFAGPDIEGKTAFNAQYDAVYGEDPSRLAALAYDGLNIAAFIADGDPKDRTEKLTDKAGFFGVDGLVQFDRDGLPRRGLAIYQIRNGRFIIIDAAPRTADGTG